MGLLDSLIGALAQSQGGAPQGGGLGDLLGSALGGAGAGTGGQANLLNIVLSMLANQGGGMSGGQGGMGGLGGLIAQFQQAGLGDVMNSWISTGENQPISPDQVSQVFGQEGLSSIASQLGVSQVDAASQLSELMPQVIDRLTPSGQAPAGGLGNMGDLLGMLLPQRR